MVSLYYCMNRESCFTSTCSTGGRGWSCRDTELERRGGGDVGHVEGGRELHVCVFYWDSYVDEG